MMFDYAVYVYESTCMYVFMYVCMYVCMYVWILSVCIDAVAELFDVVILVFLLACFLVLMRSK